MHGTFLEDCDGLCEFTYYPLPQEKESRLKFCDDISRTELRECYKDINTEFDPDNMPDPLMKSLGSASFDVEGTTDIFNNQWNKERAHLLPDSHMRAPKWGHSAEGALRRLAIVLPVCEKGDEEDFELLL